MIGKVHVGKVDAWFPMPVPHFERLIANDCFASDCIPMVPGIEFTVMPGRCR